MYYNMIYFTFFICREGLQGGLSLRGGGWGFPSATTCMNVVPGYFHRKIEETKDQKNPYSCLIPRLYSYLLYLPGNVKSLLLVITLGLIKVIIIVIIT